MTPIELAQDTAEQVPLEKRFRELETQWREETWFLSSPPKIVAHPAFRAIVALGPAVVPLMLRDLSQKSNLWVWALPEITGENPGMDVEGGNVRRLSEVWLEWGRERGLIQ